MVSGKKYFYRNRNMDEPDFQKRNLLRTS